jgi:hypothetical protein
MVRAAEGCRGLCSVSVRVVENGYPKARRQYMLSTQHFAKQLPPAWC